MSRTRINQRGFTLPELLIVLALFALLGGAGLFLLRTYPQEAERRQAARQTDVAYIVQAVSAYHRAYHTLPEAIETTEKGIGSDANEVNLCAALVPQFASDLPYDPEYGGFTVADDCNAKDQSYTTGYAIRRSQDGKTITVRAPAAQQDQPVMLTKRF